MYAWLIWFIATSFYLYEFIQRVILSIMVPEAMQAFGINSIQFTNIAAVYFFIYGMAQIPVGIIFDKFGLRIPLTLASIAVGIGSFIFTAAHGYVLALSARAIIGLGSAFAFVGCVKISTLCFPARKAATFIGLSSFVCFMGTFLAMKPLAKATVVYGWRSVNQILGVVGIIVGLLIWGLFFDEAPDDKKQHTNFFAQIKTVFTNYKIWLIALIGSLMVMPIIIYVETWGVAFLMTKHGLLKTQATLITSFALIGISLGGPIIGWISDITEKKGLLLICGNCTMIIVLLLLIYLPFFPTLTELKLLHFILGLSASSMLLCFALNNQQSSPATRGTTIGLTNTIVTGTSVSFHPLIGWIMQSFSNAQVQSTQIPNVAMFNKAFIPILLALLIATLLCCCFKLTSE